LGYELRSQGSSAVRYFAKRLRITSGNLPSGEVPGGTAYPLLPRIDSKMNEAASPGEGLRGAQGLLG